MGAIEISYAEAIRRTHGRRRHLLLGNGFSISARRAFDYRPLFEEGNGAGGEVATILSREGTSNSEVAIANLNRRLESAQYAGDDDEIGHLEGQIDVLKRYLISAVAQVHPKSGFSLAIAESQSCCRFLEPFIGRKIVPHGIVFTTNYDLMLYWVLIQNMVVHSKGRLVFEDGFAGETWRPNGFQNVNLSVVFLHGSIHIFENGGVARRVQYSGDHGHARLLDQIQRRIAADELPLFVSEGSGYAKADRMQRSAYLGAALTKFENTCKYADHVLFTVGHSLSDQDTHLMKRIGGGKIGSVYLGAFGGLNSPDGEMAQKRAEEWQAARDEAGQRWPIHVYIFDSSECRIWDGPTDNPNLPAHI